MSTEKETIPTFGLPPYHPIHDPSSIHQCFPSASLPDRVQRHSGVSSTLIPWERRRAEQPWDCRAFHFIASRYFWSSVELAFRVVCMSLIPVSVFIINVDQAIAPWLSQSVILSANLTAIIGKESLGRIINFYGQFFRALFWWLPVVTAAAALRLDEYPAAWTILYVLLLFTQASLLDGYSKRNALACFNSSMLYLLRRNPAIQMPSRLCHDWCVGILFALPAVLLPWPSLSKNTANRAVAEVATNITTAVRGLCQLMLVHNRLQRSVHLVRVQYILSRIDDTFVELKKANEEALYEFFLESTLQRKFRALKCALVKECHQNLSTMFTVALQVRDHSNLLESTAAASFGKKIQPNIDDVCLILERLVFETLPVNGSIHSVATSSLFRSLKSMEEKLSIHFEEAREDYYRDVEDDQDENLASGEEGVHKVDQFVTLSAVYIFSLFQILQSFQRFRTSVEGELANAQRHHASAFSVRMSTFIKSAVQFCIVSSFVSFRDRAKNLIFRRNEDDKRILIEAMKTSFAMTASVGFYVIMNATQALLSGPTIIAYVASNPAEAVSFSLPRLTGTILGVVLGFFISTSSESPLERMTGFCIVTAFCRMTMDVASIGTALGYTNFVALSLLGVSRKTTQSDVFSRIQQNTFAVVIYILVTLFVLPAKPTTMLKEEYASALKKIVKIYGRVSALYLETTTTFADVAVSNGTLPSFTRGTSDDGSIFMDATIGCILPAADARSFLMFPREEVDAIEKEIRGVEKSLTKCAGLVPHAASTPRMAYGVFPSHAANKLTISLRRLVTFLRVLFGSVRAFRERKTIPSPSITALLRNVGPCVTDASYEAQHLGNSIANFLLRRDVKSIPLIVEMCHTLLSIGMQMRWRKTVIGRAIRQDAVRGDTIVLEGTSFFDNTMVRSLKEAAKDSEAVHTVAFSAVEFGLELKKTFLSAALVTYYREQNLGRILTDSL